VVGKKAAFPPLGLLTVSAMLPQKWEKKLVDLNVQPLLDEDIQWADYVFISAMNVQELSVREIIEQCKKNNAIIVAGGPLFTHEHERFKEIDHFVLNEAEITLPPFLKDLQEGKPLPLYESASFADVSTTPLPDLGLINMEHYLYAIVQYSRGCPYLCDFCDVTALYGRKPRVKSAPQMIAELEAVDRSGNVQLVLFADDNLIGNKRVLKDELLPALINWRKTHNPSFYFATQLTVNLADDDELMQLLLDAGFRHVFIGIETPQEDSLKIAHKNQNLKRDLLSTIHEIHHKGFIISGGFIVGFDTDNEASFSNQIEFIQASGIPLPIVNILKAPPGTELFARMKKENRISRPFAFAEGETNIKPVMGEPALFKGFQHVIDHIYTNKHSYQRLKTFFKHHRYPKTTVKIKAKFTLAEVKIALNVIYKLGIKSKHRFHFWKLLAWVTFFNWKFLDKGVFYAIMMFQMQQTHRKISAQMLAPTPY
jgi:radical SAM superfamily enzyme YgiQ (UPF0313 family)